MSARARGGSVDKSEEHCPLTAFGGFPSCAQQLDADTDQ